MSPVGNEGNLTPLNPEDKKIAKPPEKEVTEKTNKTAGSIFSYFGSYIQSTFDYIGSMAPYRASKVKDLEEVNLKDLEGDLESVKGGLESVNLQDFKGVIFKKTGLEWTPFGEEKKNALEELRKSLVKGANLKTYQIINFSTGKEEPVLISSTFYVDVRRANFLINGEPLYIRNPRPKIQLENEEEAKKTELENLRETTEAINNLSALGKNEAAALSALVNQSLFADFGEYFGFPVLISSEKTEDKIFNPQFQINKVFKDGKDCFQVVCQKIVLLVNVAANPKYYNERAKMHGMEDLGYVTVRRELFIPKEDLSVKELEENSSLEHILNNAILDDYITPICLTPTDAKTSMERIIREESKK